MTGFEWDPDAYLPDLLEEVPGYLDLQEAVAAATESMRLETVLELGTGTGETALRVLARHPGVRWTGIDASDAMLGRARERLPDADLRLGRLEEPLPAARSTSSSRRSPCTTSTRAASATSSGASRG